MFNSIIVTLNWINKKLNKSFNRLGSFLVKKATNQSLWVPLLLVFWFLAGTFCLPFWSFYSIYNFYKWYKVPKNQEQAQEWFEAFIILVFILLLLYVFVTWVLLTYTKYSALILSKSILTVRVDLRMTIIFVKTMHTSDVFNNDLMMQIIYAYADYVEYTAYVDGWKYTTCVFTPFYDKIESEVLELLSEQELTLEQARFLKVFYYFFVWCIYGTVDYPPLIDFIYLEKPRKVF